MGFSPRTRGCSVVVIWLAFSAPVFPAHAGMFRQEVTFATVRDRFPRARGDVPTPACGGLQNTPFSPRTRGCSVTTHPSAAIGAVFPAHAGMFRDPHVKVDVSKLFSPRTRGCSWYNIPSTIARAVFPAHAGMFLFGS